MFRVPRWVQPYEQMTFGAVTTILGPWGEVWRVTELTGDPDMNELLA